MTEKLLPCPRCGKKPIIEMWSSGGPMYMCKCNNPDCDVPPDGYPKGRSPASVIEEWNRRDKMAKLLPCPFCGGTPILELFNDGFFDYARIRCCRVMFDWCGDETGEKAIAAWNRRSDAVPVVRCVEWMPAKDPYDRVYCYRHAGCGCEHNEQSAYCPNCGADNRGSEVKE